MTPAVGYKKKHTDAYISQQMDIHFGHSDAGKPANECPCENCVKDRTTPKCQECGAFLKRPRGRPRPGIEILRCPNDCSKEDDSLCHTCDGQGGYIEACSDQDCPPQCPGHEVACRHCNGTGNTR